jgi:hypothetical protein
MKKFLLGTAIAVTLVSATSVVFAESSLSAFEGIPSESVEALELDAVSGKGTVATQVKLQNTGTAKVLSQSNVTKPTNSAVIWSKIPVTPLPVVKTPTYISAPITKPSPKNITLKQAQNIFAYNPMYPNSGGYSKDTGKYVFPMR